MFIDKNSITVNGISLGQYLTKAKYGFFDVWSDDTGYTLSNTFIGTFRGTFPKLTLTFRPLKKNELDYLTTNIFRTTTQTLTYYDPQLGYKTISTHKGDVEYECNKIGQSKEFNFSLVGNGAL